MELKLNRPLANTYGWLRVNGTRTQAAISSDVQLREELPEGVKAETGGEALCPALKTGAGEDVTALLAGRRQRLYRVPQGVKVPDTLRLYFDFDETDAGAVVVLELADNSELTVVMDYAGGIGTAAVQTRALLGKNAVLRLAQIQRMNEDARFINDVGARCEEGARVEWTRLVLGGKESFDGFSAALAGDGSSLTIDTGYRLAGDERLDMNYEAVHTGRKSNCEMNVAGVLSDRAFKLLRGTIDLRRGCAGAVGNEVEDVLLMDETVRNQTVPVILCAEEDVVGNHGATIGRLDEQLIYYLESRGLEREAAYEMMARARVDAVIRRIPDEKTVRSLLPEEREEEA